MTSLSVRTVNSAIPDFPVSSAPVVVRAFESRDAERWDRFVLEHPAGTFFHQMAWKRVVEKTFDHQSGYVYGDRVQVQPMFARNI